MSSASTRVDFVAVDSTAKLAIGFALAPTEPGRPDPPACWRLPPKVGGNANGLFPPSPILLPGVEIEKPRPTCRQMEIFGQMACWPSNSFYEFRILLLMRRSICTGAHITSSYLRVGEPRTTGSYGSYVRLYPPRRRVTMWATEGPAFPPNPAPPRSCGGSRRVCCCAFNFRYAVYRS